MSLLGVMMFKVRNNKMVGNHYLELGFTKIESAETAQFELNVDEYQERECFIDNVPSNVIE